MRIFLLVFFIIALKTSILAQAPTVQMVEKYFEFVDIDYNSPEFSLKEGQMLRIWDNKDTRKNLIRYASIYRIYLHRRPIVVELISNNTLGITTLFRGCQTDFTAIYNEKSSYARSIWQLKKVKYPRKKGKTTLYFKKQDAEDE